MLFDPVLGAAQRVLLGLVGMLGPVGAGGPAHLALAPVPLPAAASVGSLAPGRPFAPSAIATWATEQSALCVAAIAEAERRHGVPPGLLLAISKVESGRPLPPAGQLGPWPWTTDADGVGSYYDTKERALEGAAAALRRGALLDVGCMQVNLRHHPNAFATLDQALDPAANADYAARLLVRLQQGPAAGDWRVAAGYYHSQSPALAAAYRTRVEAVLAGLPMPRGGPAPLFSRAVQRGVLRLGLPGGAVRVVPVAARFAGPRRPSCTALPGGATACVLR